MRTRFTFISLLLLILVASGYFLSYMGGFLQIDSHHVRSSLRFWEHPGPAEAETAVTTPYNP